MFNSNIVNVYLSSRSHSSSKGNKMTMITHLNKALYSSLNFICTKFKITGVMNLFCECPACKLPIINL